MRINAALAVLCYLVCGISLAQAQTLVFETVATDEMIHSFVPGVQSTDAQPLSFVTPSVALADYNAMEITIHAPTGLYWRIQPALGATNQFIGLQVQNSGGPPAPHASAFNFSWSFSFVEGGMDSLTTSTIEILSISESTGNDFHVAVSYGVQDIVAFNSLTFSFEYDNSEMATAILNNLNNSSLVYFVQTTSEIDQGPFMQAIPEPASLMLLGTGSLLLLIRRQHDAS